MPRSATLNEEMRDRSRARLMETALRLFADKGFDGTSLSSITREAGVAHGLANYHFGSKRDLLAACIAPRLRMVLSAFEGLPDDADKALGALIDGFVDEARAQPDQQRLFLSVMIQPGIREVFAEVEQELAEELAAAEDVICGIFRRRGAKDPELDMIMLRSVVEGVLFKFAVYPDSYPLEQARCRLHTMMGLPEPKPRRGRGAARSPRLRSTT